MSVNEYNSSVRRWANETKRKTKLRTLQLVSHIGPGYNNQKVSVRTYLGEANRIQFQFPYYMVFVHKGAGRGYGGTKSGKYTKLDGSKGITRRSSMGKMGTGKRMAKPWFNPVIAERFPELAAIVVDYNGIKISEKIDKVLIK